MICFLKRNKNEIQNALTLRLYGFILTLTHIFTFITWEQGGLGPSILSNQEPRPLCWVFFPNCNIERFSAFGAQAVLIFYLVLTFVVAGFFLFRKSAGWAYYLSFFLWALKWLIMIQDYRMMGNYHYMAFLVAFAFLLLPNKENLIRYLVVGFYLSAGFLKLNPEWMTGAAIYGKPPLQGRVLELACIYVVFLELFISFGLLAETSWIFWLAIAQFSIFHLFSWSIVGFYYPCVMFCLLSIFVLPRFFSVKPFRKNSKLVFITLAIYAFAQLVPVFFPGDTSLTGEGRIFALNMFDSQAECRSYIFSRFDGGSADEGDSVPRVGRRIQCDPVVYWNVGRKLCERYQNNTQFKDIDIFLYSKRTSGTSYQPILEIKNFCKLNPPYLMFQHNPWILSGEAGK